MSLHIEEVNKLAIVYSSTNRYNSVNNITMHTLRVEAQGSLRVITSCPKAASGGT